MQVIFLLSCHAPSSLPSPTVHYLGQLSETLNAPDKLYAFQFIRPSTGLPSAPLFLSLALWGLPLVICGWGWRGGRGTIIASQIMQQINQADQRNKWPTLKAPSIRTNILFRTPRSVIWQQKWNKWKTSKHLGRTNIIYTIEKGGTLGIKRKLSPKDLINKKKIENYFFLNANQL